MSEYLNSFAKEITAKFRRLNKLVNHKVSIGNYHEIILRSLLEKFLSKRFGVKTGFVLDSSNGKVSKQIDILIIDENAAAPYYFIEGDFVVAKPENIVAAIEVKTVMNRDNFLASMENCREFRTTGASGQFYVFSYDGGIPNSEGVSEWYKSVGTEHHNFFNYPSNVCMVKGGILQLLSKSFLADPGHCHMVLGGDEAEDAVTSYFLASIIKAAEDWVGNKKANPFTAYGSIPDITVSKKVYRFGSGVADADLPFKAKDV